MKKNLSKAFAEVLYILDNIEIQYKVKVPKNMLDMFKDECDKKYLNILHESKGDFLDKDYSKDSLAIISYLNLKYWCETKEEKKYYRDMLFENDKENRRTIVFRFFF